MDDQKPPQVSSIGGRIETIKARPILFGGGGLLVVLTLVLIVVLTGCGDTDPEAATTSTASPAGGGATTSATIAEGGTIASETKAPDGAGGNDPAPDPIDSNPLTGEPPATAGTDDVADAVQVALTDRLAVQPVDGGVYLLGNSMFKTGVDLEAMQQAIPERDVRFNYYDGHYTSLWYLIAETALGPSEERPELIVWGFRPRYAMFPAFRQNRPNSTELFEFEDSEYERLTGDSFESGDFLTGPTVGFADGFIPLTAQSFAEHDLAQLVVIWRPVNVANGEPVALEQRFVSDATRYFEEHDIPFVDFYNDERINLTMFGKGDHYNTDGRAQVTLSLIEEISRLLEAG